MKNLTAFSAAMILLVLLFAQCKKDKTSPMPIPENNCNELPRIDAFEKTSDVSNRPELEVVVPEDYKIVGGGAYASCPGSCVYFLASYPPNERTWFAKAKDHIYQANTIITVRVLAIYDPNDEFDVRIFQNTGSMGHFPEAVATVDPLYILTGGGARSNSIDPGILLTASYPASSSTWEVKGKDHRYPSPGTVTAYAIGIKSNKNCTLENRIFTSTSEVSHHPSGKVWVEDDWKLVGGGAKANWQSEGSLLTGSYASGNQAWTGSSTDLKYPEQTSISLYAIGLRLNE